MQAPSLSSSLSSKSSDLSLEEEGQVSFVREAVKKRIQNVNFFHIGLDPPPSPLDRTSLLFKEGNI